MTLHFVPVPPTIEQLKARAASGHKGCVEARRKLIALRTEQLRAELAEVQGGGR